MFCQDIFTGEILEGRIRIRQGSVVKRLRHRPFTAVTRVQFPSESFLSEYKKLCLFETLFFETSFFGPLAQLVRATGS